MAGYVIKKREPYKITGADGDVYEIPAASKLSVEDIDLLIRFNETSDVKTKLELCREFLLKYAPGLEKENLGDTEYFMIFTDYNTTQTDTLGES